MQIGTLNSCFIMKIINSSTTYNLPLAIIKQPLHIEVTTSEVDKLLNFCFHHHETNILQLF